MIEEWRDIKNYEGRYQVSSMGRVKSLERKIPHWRGGERIQKERILEPATTYHGYLRVGLHAGGKQKMLMVHRLVCEAFHENPDNKQQVNHVNEDKTDNRAYNLEWSTPRENCNFGTRNTRVAKALSKRVGQYALDGKLVKTWESLAEIKKRTGFYHSAICEVANGKRKQAYGFVWKYI